MIRVSMLSSFHLLWSCWFDACKTWTLGFRSVVLVVRALLGEQGCPSYHTEKLHCMRPKLIITARDPVSQESSAFYLEAVTFASAVLRAGGGGPDPHLRGAAEYGRAAA
jgi:hypothetical protein